jgi:hypothetical protein
MLQDDRQRALSIIESEQRGNESPISGTASVVVEVGGTDDEGIVEKTTLYLHKAPDRVIEALRDEGYAVDLHGDGAKVSVPEDNSDDDK